MKYELMGKLIDRAMQDPAFREQLRKNPEGAVKQGGMQLSGEELAALRKIDWTVSDQELKSRISKAV